MKKIKILVAEDDDHIREGLLETLASEGYETLAARDGREAIEKFLHDAPGLILLDIMMPMVSGFDVCLEIRKSNKSVPIIMLTAKGEEVDKVLGLKLGADDYVTKPFGVRELLARIAAVLRRTQETTRDIMLPLVIEFGDAKIERKRFKGTLNNREFELTAREMKLIEVFAAHPGEVLSRNDLLNEVWGIDYFGTTRTLDQHIAQLRKKIELTPAIPATLTTVHGVGYRFEG